MKTGPFTPKPGDLFKWHLDDHDAKCLAQEIWSASMNRYVLIMYRDVNILIAMWDNHIMWFNGKRVLSAKMNNTIVHPRKLT